jgi:hypothetical protein
VLSKLTVGRDDVVAGWGAWPDSHPKFSELGPLRLVDVAGAVGLRRLICFGRTKSGAPRHPLFVPYTQPAELLWRSPGFACSCDEGWRERVATPNEVDAGCELGITLELCPRCRP